MGQHVTISGPQFRIEFETPDSIDDDAEGNATRAEMVRPYYESFGQLHYGYVHGWRGEEEADPNMIVSDMLADMLHLARSIGADPEEVLQRAAGHFAEEEALAEHSGDMTESGLAAEWSK